MSNSFARIKPRTWYMAIALLAVVGIGAALVKRETSGYGQHVETSLLEAMLDPVSIALANAPYDDEPVSEEEARSAAASRAWLKDNEPISNEDVLAEFGLTGEDFERMGRTPLESQSPDQ